MIRRPAPAEIEQFLERCEKLPLSYGPTGIVWRPAAAGRLDEEVVTIGRGRADFERARLALTTWKHFDIDWVHAFPRPWSVEPGTNVAVLIRHLGFWSLNGARVLHHVNGSGGATAFGFVYGTLTSHAESGEELFEVSLDAESGDVRYRIRALSWPQHVLTRVGQPVVRLLQARFRSDSAAAMRRAVMSIHEKEP